MPHNPLSTFRHAGFVVVEELTKGALAGDRIWLVAKYSQVINGVDSRLHYCHVCGRPLLRDCIHLSLENAEIHCHSPCLPESMPTTFTLQLNTHNIKPIVDIQIAGKDTDGKKLRLAGYVLMVRYRGGQALRPLETTTCIYPWLVSAVSEGCMARDRQLLLVAGMILLSCQGRCVRRILVNLRFGNSLLTDHVA